MKTTLKFAALTVALTLSLATAASAQSILNGIANIVAAANNRPSNYPVQQLNSPYVIGGVPVQTINGVQRGYPHFSSRRPYALNQSQSVNPVTWNQRSANYPSPSPYYINQQANTLQQNALQQTRDLNFLSTVAGTYQHNPMLNAYHWMTVVKTGTAYRITVGNGESYDLTLDTTNKQLVKHYNDQNNRPQVDYFKFITGQDGKVTGFTFRGVYFSRTP